TQGLSETGNVVDTTCTGATITIPSCSVKDGNIIFYVTNNSSTYDFATSDNFVFDVTSDTGVYNADNNLSTYTSEAWAGLSTGATVQVSASLTTLAVTGNSYDVAVRSSICSSDAVYTFKNCHS
ncbi:MAG: hypothetical protein PHR26_02575, partial [Candidatus ainarchaeum sp.]|nr:hypothetical protein [Candidatus ainarchaeum sp.]